jgi:flagellar biosynthesis/type III secretory pathway chaperone
MTNSTYLHRENVAPLINELKEVMKREVSILREMLGTQSEEQQAILTNDTETLQRVMKGQEGVMAALLERRKHRIALMHDIVEGHPHYNLERSKGNDEVAESLIYKHGSDDCELLVLREQMLTLMEQIKVQTERNGYLTKNKVALTKEMIRRLYPNNKSATYGKDGTVSGKKRCAFALINQEG